MAGQGQIHQAPSSARGTVTRARGTEREEIERERERKRDTERERERERKRDREREREKEKKEGGRAHTQLQKQVKMMLSYIFLLQPKVITLSPSLLTTPHYPFWPCLRQKLVEVPHF